MPENANIKRSEELLQFVDTHCHLEMPQFDEDRAEVIRRALDEGIRYMITIGSDFESNFEAIRLSEMHNEIYCSVGIHPHDASSFTEETFNKLKQWAAHDKVVAIGETGLDYHYDNSPRDIQQEVFRSHLRLALETGLPAVIHSREADEDTISILRESGIKSGVIHCFSGSRALYEAARSMGLYISIAGPVTFKKALELQEVAAEIPDEMLLIETDAPYLAPLPYRGKRNEPSYVKYTAENLAEIRGVRLHDIARITTLNAITLFKLEPAPTEGETVYMIRDSLYLNITARCTNKCSFCTRFRFDYVKGHYLRLSSEPSFEELKEGIGDPSACKEIVFCGLGEPTLRLDLITKLSRWIKDNGGKVRINTNGHGSLIHKRNIVPELRGLVDSVSVSLDAHSAEAYDELCKPDFKDAYPAVIEFIKEARKYIPHVQATVVETKGVDLEKCRQIAKDLGISFRVRKLNYVG